MRKIGLSIPADHVNLISRLPQADYSNSGGVEEVDVNTIPAGVQLTVVVDRDKELEVMAVLPKDVALALGRALILCAEAS